MAMYGSIPAWAGKPVVMRPHLGAIRVYPRVGGETEDTGNASGDVAGLSPRGRGNRE